MGAAHSYDWDRFYDFLIGCHKRDEDLEQPSTVLAALRKVGAPDDNAVEAGAHDPTELASIYYAGREILRRYEND